MILRSKVHHCISQEMVAQGLADPPAKKCNCRKSVPYKEADRLVKNGEASWVVVKREKGTQEVTCTLCKGDPEIKNCAQCKGTGKVTKPANWDTYNNDIVFVSEASVDPKEKKYRPALAMKTPRVATIESEHIERAYLIENADAVARIEEYGELVLEARAFPGPAKCSHGKTKILNGETIEIKCARCEYPEGMKVYVIGVEPKNDRRTGTGRRYDYGRAI